MRNLIAERSIRLSISDKGGEFVVIPQTLDKEIAKLHLSDDTVYQVATKRDFLAQCRKLNDVWISVGRSAGLDEKLITRLKLDNPNCPVFYHMIKTHKLAAEDFRPMSPVTYKIRPLISCVGGPTDRISWFLNKILSQLLPKVPSHLPNTQELVKQLRSMNIERGSIVESFDVTSLYTNVQNDAALQALSEMLDKNYSTMVTFGLSKTCILTLIRECLKCNIFKWSGTYYSQIRGLAMGQRLAPVLAICYMSKIEEPVLARLPLMYCRYIDDCYIITSTQSEMDECFRVLNQQSQYIKFTRETPQNGWLSFLNTRISLCNDVIRVKWYRKGSSKNILIHATSAHPAAVKCAVIRNMFNTAVGVCTGEEERLESRRLASSIARSNGYVVAQLPQMPRRITNYGSRAQVNENKIPLYIPFISEEFSMAVKLCIARAELQNDVMLVNIPNDNIKKQ